MKKADLNKIINYQDYWKNMLPRDKAVEYIALSRELLHQIIDNNNQLPTKHIQISPDFSDDAIYYVFLKIYGKKVTSITKVSNYKIVEVDLTH